MDITKILTEKEVRSRKIWLWLLLAGYAFSYITFITMVWQVCNLAPIEGSHIHERLMRISNFIGLAMFPINWVVSYLTYQLCYRKPKTFLLTFALIGYAIGSMGLIFSALMGTFVMDSLLFISIILMILSFPYTWKMRQMNKVLRCYTQASDLCKDAITHLEEAKDKIHLKELFDKGRKRWPILKPLLKREYFKIMDKFK